VVAGARFSELRLTPSLQKRRCGNVWPERPPSSPTAHDPVGPRCGCALALHVAFTAANVVPGTKAGDGAGAITGYTVTNVQYQLDAADASLIESVSFTLDAAATSVRAKVVAASTTYTTCTNTGGNNWSGDINPDPTVLSADELRVIATS
jgi:hypothetical protein